METPGEPAATGGCPYYRGLVRVLIITAAAHPAVRLSVLERWLLLHTRGGRLGKPGTISHCLSQASGPPACGVWCGGLLRLSRSLSGAPPSHVCSVQTPAPFLQVSHAGRVGRHLLDLSCVWVAFQSLSGKALWSGWVARHDLGPSPALGAPRGGQALSPNSGGAEAVTAHVHEAFPLGLLSGHGPFSWTQFSVSSL